MGIGCDPEDALFKIYKSINPRFEIGDGIARMQMGVVANAWDWAEESQPGDAVIRTLSTLGRHGIILYMSNNDMDGRSYIKFGDGGNHLWFSIFNNRTVRIDGTVYAKEIRVQSDVWSDFVFEPNYNLRPIKDVERFVNNNKHLSDVPSATQIFEGGINLSQMNALLLQKVEELTLYIIELNNRIELIESSK